MSDDSLRKRLAAPDPRIVDLLQSHTTLELEEVRDKDFVHCDVYLDGRRFVNCTFLLTRCYVTFGNFAIDTVRFDRTTFVPEGPALNVAALINSTEGD